jgi:hypothetical protein
MSSDPGPRGRCSHASSRAEGRSTARAGCLLDWAAKIRVGHVRESPDTGTRRGLSHLRVRP